MPIPAEYCGSVKDVVDKMIQRLAYGYWDSEFFFMKIKNDFPGNP